MSDKPGIGTIGWHDLTVENADEVRDFYSRVVGWEPSAVDMGEYSDYSMAPPGGEPVGGVCHARGSNTGLPAQWLMYVTVADADDSARRCVELGGRVLAGPKSFGPTARYCVIEDPVGAVLALYSEQTDSS